MPFVAISTGVDALSSKISLFLVVHKAQRIHGSTKFGTPVGGRQMADRNLTSIVFIVSSKATITSCFKGTNSQTFFVNRHEKKRCIGVSCSLHLGQFRSAVMPRLCRFSPMGIAFWMMDQRNTFSFGENFPDQTSLIHRKSCSSACWVWGCLSAAAVA